MTNFVEPSPEALSERRRSLRKQRRVRNLQHVWRVLAISGLAVGALWLIRNPFWLLLRHSEQVTIEGNEMLADDAVHELLALKYPQPIFEVEPEQLINRLKTQSPIAQAQIDRQLFPPRLEITLQERLPVAVTIPSRLNARTEEPTPASQPGLLDAKGYWMAQETAAGLNNSFQLPTLKVRGFHPRYQQVWPGLYHSLQNSPIKILEVDLRSPNNLKLQTEVGRVHLGIYNPQQLPEQLALLPRLSSLTTNPDTPQVDYIDLANPQVPAVKLSQPPEIADSTPQEN
ncbi:MAG: cell division protein FtsQ/DivIB [Leptolyngbyaceae cyanobacterium]